ncbi:MAG: aminotransferase class III-fold pyridoxal phosphate-dependent enzyme, partial [Mucispirillum sp.]|nr:aminotransferase class III-fold pyridoxal phosphate-dependent enzyme [Mucispirillum sp.]
VVPVDAEFLKAVRQICDENDMLMILDEVQTGYGRTGKLFAYQLFGAEPDIMSLAKGIANGVPMGAIAVKNEIAELFIPGSHGSTFGGNPLACAAGIAVIKEMTKDGFLESVVEKGHILREYISSELAGDCVLRGEGLLIGVETKIPPRDVVEACFKKKLLVIPAGSGSVRLYPPLNICRDDLLEGAKIYVSVIKELLK